MLICLCASDHKPDIRSGITNNETPSGGGVDLKMAVFVVAILCMLLLLLVPLQGILFYATVIDSIYVCICWFVCGRIKEKVSTIYAIKYQVYCMEIQYSDQQIQYNYFNLPCSKQPPLISMPAYVYS